MAKAQYVQEIEGAIEAARSLVIDHGEKFSGHGKEIQTRYRLIDPILRALDWDVSDPNQVQVEYPRNGRFPDYAFFTQGSETPIMILEAKSIPSGDIAEFLGEEFEENDQYEDEEGEWDDDDDEDWEDDEEWDDEDENVEGLGEFKDVDIDTLRRPCRRLYRGYGVLSRGSLWSIFDLSLPPANPRSASGFLRKRIAHFSILSSPIEECVEHLRRLHRRNIQRSFR